MPFLRLNSEISETRMLRRMLIGTVTCSCTRGASSVRCRDGESSASIIVDRNLTLDCCALLGSAVRRPGDHDVDAATPVSAAVNPSNRPSSKDLSRNFEKYRSCCAPWQTHRTAARRDAIRLVVAPLAFSTATPAQAENDRQICGTVHPFDFVRPSPRCSP